MTHEKIVVKENGDKVKLRVNFWENYGQAKYEVSASLCVKGKRLFKPVYDTDDYRYRRLEKKERDEWIENKILEHATAAEIMQAKIECWQLLKPCL